MGTAERESGEGEQGGGVRGGKGGGRAVGERRVLTCACAWL